MSQRSVNQSRLRVAVLYGGRTGEHEVSLRSAESIIAALNPERYDVQRILITKEGRWQPRAIAPEPGANHGIDVVFPVLHGTFGEDGTVQGLLELADIAYVGAGVLASSVSMDKEVMKRLLIERGLPIVEYLTVRRGKFRGEDVCGRFPFPSLCEARESGLVGGSFEGEIVRRTAGRARVSRRKFDRKIVDRARHQGTRVRMLRARQRRSGGRRAVRNPAFARVLRLRRQISV